MFFKKTTNKTSFFFTYMIAKHTKLTTLAGILCPGKYLTFSWSWLMISVSFLPSTISSYTYIVTTLSNWSNLLALDPTIFAIAEPLRIKIESQLLSSKTTYSLTYVLIIIRWAIIRSTKMKNYVMIRDSDYIQFQNNFSYVLVN